MALFAFARVVCVALLATLLVCCFGFTPAAAQVPDASTHRLAIGDMLQVTLYDGVNAVNTVVQIDNTGSVRLPLLEPVSLVGLYSYEAAYKLTELYKTFYVNPVTSLTIQQYGLFNVFLFGPDIAGRLMDLPNGTRLLDLMQMLSQSSSTGKALLTTGRFRRVHIIRGGFSLTALLAPPTVGPGQESSSPAQNLLQSKAPEAVARNTGNLAAFTNWRPWVEARKKDPNSKVWILDPLQLTVEGELSRYNLPLQDGDVLYLPSPERFIDIEGVTDAGRYELLGAETLGDVLRMAGTPNYEADLMNAVVRRYDERGDVERIYFNFYPVLDDIEAARAFTLQNRDRISFYARESRVFVMGEVNEAGAFAFQDDGTVLDYIALAKGETKNAHLAWIAIIRQSRDRLDPLAGAKVIQVNFKRIHAGLPNCTDIYPEKGDLIYVPPKGFEFDAASIIQAVGTVVTGFKLATDSTSSNTSNGNGGT